MASFTCSQRVGRQRGGLRALRRSPSDCQRLFLRRLEARRTCKHQWWLAPTLLQRLGPGPLGCPVAPQHAAAGECAASMHTPAQTAVYYSHCLNHDTDAQTTGRCRLPTKCRLEEGAVRSHVPPRIAIASAAAYMFLPARSMRRRCCSAGWQAASGLRRGASMQNCGSCKTAVCVHALGCTQSP